ncbi:MAG: aminoacyl-tRNA hydrolase [Candidatus Solibacter usitatus]|nr:aminoacyl-tRNA hydrolase [Candidatus Solibacter usitatus]
MFLVVGLGNPGEEYAATPHNAGFRVIDRLAGAHGIRVSRKDSQALAGVGQIAGRPVMLAKPQTFMNLSGAAVARLMEKHRIAVGDLIVIWDELNLPWGGLRVLAKGSAGGHNGAQSVIRSVGTQEFCRVRLGVNPGHPVRDGAEYLLAPMRRPQQQELEAAEERAAEAVASIIAEGVEKSMTKYNRRAQGSREDA